MDLGDSEEDRERALLWFYKEKRNWASPLNCTLEGWHSNTQKHNHTH